MRMRKTNSQNWYATLASKILEIFQNDHPHSRKFSEFENENENSHVVRPRFTTLLNTKGLVPFVSISNGGCSPMGEMDAFAPAEN